MRPDIKYDLDLGQALELLETGARALGVVLSPGQRIQFQAYLELLLQWNRHLNLTGLKALSAVVERLFLDSLTLVPFLPEGVAIMDLGSGAGFPGLPVKIARPSQRLVLVESSAKKVSFLKEAVRRLRLDQTLVFHAFLGKGAPSFAPPYPLDFIVSRAVGKTGDLLRIAAACLKPGGRLILMKGRHWRQEVAAAAPMALKSGFRLEKTKRVAIPNETGGERVLLFFLKED